MKQIPGYPGYYATEDGLLFSDRGPGGGGIDERNRHQLTPHVTKNGYLAVTMPGLGRKRQQHKSVHRLVLLAFSGQPPTGKNIGRHLDGNRHNNTPGNLAWGDMKDNSDDMARLGERTAVGDEHWTRKRPDLLCRGERQHAAKLTEDAVRCIRRSAESQSALARKYGVSKPVIASVRKHKTWRHVS